MLDIIDVSIKHLLLAVELIALCTCIIHYNKLGLFKPYILVYSSGFIQCFTAVLWDPLICFGSNSIELSFALISIFLIAELLANCLVYLTIFKGRTDRLVISILFVLQTTSIVNHFVRALNKNYDHTFLFLSQSFILLILVGRIIQVEYRKENDSTPARSPILFFAFSTFFFCLFTLPIYLFHDYALHNSQSTFGYLYIINDVAYIIYTFLILTSFKWMRNSTLSA